MNIKECYELMNGDYDGVIRRLMTDERVKKFVLKLVQSSPIDEILENLESKDYPTAFRNVHNMKGVALNLGLTVLADSSSELCEAIRGGEPSTDITPLVDKLQADYNRFLEVIAQLD